MKKIISFAILLSLIFWLNYKNSFAEEKYFVVTAYYSPLPGQNYYMRWDLEKEKILQWEGTHWASWKTVFSGMLAAPKIYWFWTKIYLEWLWVWVVEDRGQAIVKSWERGYKYDRLDVWMWYGDEWLRRTLAWWKRTIKWEILPSDSKVTINYKNHEAPDWAVSHLKKQEKFEKISEKIIKIDEKIEKTVFDINIWKDSNSEDIKKLQNFLKEIWLYKWKIDWVYNSEIISIILNFQLENTILQNSSDFWAWYWWEKTKSLFQKKYLKWEFKNKKVENIKIEEGKTIENKEIKEVSKKSENIFEYFELNDENIKEVEKIFNEIWYFSEKVNFTKENFSKNILKFQLDEKIISSENEVWAWFFWPKTRKILKNKYDLFIDKNLENEKKFSEIKKIYLDFENEAEKISLDKVKNLKNKILKKWEISSEVRDLQNILKENWYLKENSTAIFWEKTFDAILKFQLENKIILDDKSENAWIFWEKEFISLKENLKKNYINEKIIEKWFSIEDLKNFEI